MLTHEVGGTQDHPDDHRRGEEQLEHHSQDTVPPVPQFAPRLNHVAISLSPDVLDDRGRADILDFYGRVFGWIEGDNTGEEGNPLILYTGEFGQFVYLLPADPPLVAPALDHFGLQVATREQLLDIVSRAKDYAVEDPRVGIIDVHDRITHGSDYDYVLTSAYISFLLPLQIELQHLERVAK